MLKPLSKGEMQRIHKRPKDGYRYRTNMIRISFPRLMYYFRSDLILSSTCLQNFSSYYMFILFVLFQNFPLSLILSVNGESF
jgi:hypothetical protein